LLPLLPYDQYWHAGNLEHFKQQSEAVATLWKPEHAEGLSFQAEPNAAPHK
jgi:hypothetical protein